MGKTGTKRSLMRRSFILVAMVGAAGVCSRMTTVFHVDSRIPGGEGLSITARDSDGGLIQQARLRINVSGPIPGFQLFQSTSGNTITTDTGVLHLTVPEDGWEFGSSGWYLFWCIRIWRYRPLPDRVVLEVSADGYLPGRVRARELLDRKKVVVFLEKAGAR